MVQGKSNLTVPWSIESQARVQGLWLSQQESKINLIGLADWIVTVYPWFTGFLWLACFKKMFIVVIWCMFSLITMAVFLSWCRLSVGITCYVVLYRSWWPNMVSCLMESFMIPKVRRAFIMITWGRWEQRIINTSNSLPYR